MSTIASPRPSLSISSRRTSTSTDAGPRSPSASRGSTAGSLRRNRDRTALRDYYGLKNAGPADARTDSVPPTPTLSLAPEQESELDRPDFDAETYVQQLLAKEGLEGVLRVEAGLVSEIRSLDGEKKALVYDNYSKLIAATETIRRMREKMDPGMETRTLMGDIERIGETAAQLSGEMRQVHGAAGTGDEAIRKTKQQQTVRWVLGAPTRLSQLVDDGKRDQAEKQWNDVRTLLDRWQNVKGVDELRQACKDALSTSDAG